MTAKSTKRPPIIDESGTETEPTSPATTPQVDTGSPEFQAAVKAAVDQATSRILESFGNLRAQAPEQSADLSLARQIALGIAEIADQGTTRKRVAPEILAKRAAARDMLEKTVARAYVQGFKPEYRITNQTYLEERLLHPFYTDPVTKRVEPVEVLWSGIPNESMYPINPIAVEIFNLYMESIGGMTVIDEKTHDGRSFVPDTRPFSVTPGGLTVKGELRHRRVVSNLPDSNNGTHADPRLSIKGQNDPRAREVHVLGTVAPPAVQNAYDSPAALSR